MRVRAPATLLLVAVVAAGGCDAQGGDGEAAPSTGTTATTASAGATTTTPRARECPGGATADVGDVPDDAVAADLDGDGTDGAVWVEPVAGEPAVLHAVLSGGLALEATMGEREPPLEPKIVSVVDVGDRRDTVLARFGTGAYTELVGTFGYARCELVPVVNPETSEGGPFVLARGASVRNGSSWGCFDTSAGTALLRVSWHATEEGESFEWSEGVFRRDGTEMTRAGEVVTGTAPTEDDVGTGRAGPCPQPEPASP